MIEDVDNENLQEPADVIWPSRKKAAELRVSRQTLERSYFQPRELEDDDEVNF